jgi:hypothetical protein
VRGQKPASAAEQSGMNQEKFEEFFSKYSSDVQVPKDASTDQIELARL